MKLDLQLSSPVLAQNLKPIGISIAFTELPLASPNAPSSRNDALPDMAPFMRENVDEFLFFGVDRNPKVSTLVDVGEWERSPHLRDVNENSASASPCNVTQPRCVLESNLNSCAPFRLRDRCQPEQVRGIKRCVVDDSHLSPFLLRDALRIHSHLHSHIVRCLDWQKFLLPRSLQSQPDKPSGVDRDYDATEPPATSLQLLTTPTHRSCKIGHVLTPFRLLKNVVRFLTVHSYCSIPAFFISPVSRCVSMTYLAPVFDSSTKKKR